MTSLAFSVLDLVGMRGDETAGAAIARTVATAQHAESLGYRRYLMAEHHSMHGIACSATSVLIGHVAGATKTIRVGSGGVMLPNHAPLIIAEQFGTLESLYPGRIDLGLGRAPGSDGPTMHALRRDLQSSGDDFPALLEELRSYLGAPRPGQRVFAVPGENTNVPITLLGSSVYSAQLAGQLGLPFAFAAHFAPDLLMPALHLYRENFRAVASLQQPYAMVCLPILVADTDEQARYLFTTSQQRFLSLIRNQPLELKPPVETLEHEWNPMEREAVQMRLQQSVIGSQETVAAKLRTFIANTGVQEIITQTETYELDDRLRSLTLLAGALS